MSLSCRRQPFLHSEGLMGGPCTLKRRGSLYPSLCAFQRKGSMRPQLAGGGVRLSSDFHPPGMMVNIFPQSVVFFRCVVPSVWCPHCSGAHGRTVLADLPPCQILFICHIRALLDFAYYFL